MVRTQINTMNRFEILRQHDFTCVYCGARPGNELLEIDHMIPHSIGGSDHWNNLVPACRRCNNGKREQVSFPKSQCDPGDGTDGWMVWKRWGNWSIQWRPGTIELWDIVIEHVNGYWVGFDRVHEPDWQQHMEQKKWMNTIDEFENFLTAIEFARSVVEEH